MATGPVSHTELELTVDSHRSVGDIEIGIAAGVESMSTNPRPEPFISEELGTLSSEATDALNPMGWTR